jgi:sRNA-binding protein
MGPHPNKRKIISLPRAATPPVAPVGTPPPALAKLPPVTNAMRARTKRKLARAAALAWLATEYPKAFGVEVKPLALGTGARIWLAAKEAGIKRAALNSALKHHIPSFRYFDALIADGMRCDLDGNAVEPVTDEHRKRAIEMTAERLQIRQAYARSHKGSRP